MGDRLGLVAGWRSPLAHPSLQGLQWHTSGILVAYPVANLVAYPVANLLLCWFPIVRAQSIHPSFEIRELET